MVEPSRDSPVFNETAGLSETAPVNPVPVLVQAISQVFRFRGEDIFEYQVGGHAAAPLGQGGGGVGDAPAVEPDMHQLMGAGRPELDLRQTGEYEYFQAELGYLSVDGSSVENGISLFLPAGPVQRDQSGPVNQKKLRPEGADEDTHLFKPVMYFFENFPAPHLIGHRRFVAEPADSPPVAVSPASSGGFLVYESAAV